MPEWLPAVVTGVVLLLLAAALGIFHWRAWVAGPLKLPPEDILRHHAARQLRRRLQVSGLLAVIGVMIPLGDVLPVFRRAPLLFVIYWLAVLGLVVWMVLLVLGDLASNVAFHRLAQSDLHTERKKLQDEIRRYHAEGNGRSRADHPES